MAFHRRLEALPVNRYATFGQYLRRKVRREAAFRVQAEEPLSRNDPCRIGLHAIQQAQPGSQYVLETALFIGQQRRNMWRALALVGREQVFSALHQGRYQLAQEWLLQPKDASLARRPTDETTDNVATTIWPG
jgi:hypothetical protein